MSAEPIYTLERHRHGWLVRGSIPLDDFQSLSGLGGRKAVWVPGIATALGATMAICPTREDADAWRTKIDDAAAQIPDRLLGWLRSTDTGMSSRYIAWMMAGKSHGITAEPAVPLDMDDFGRCRRLVDLMGWRIQMHRMSSAGPEWSRVVNAWDALVGLNDEGRKGRLDDIMTEIEAGGATP